MKAYGVPRVSDVEWPDVADIKRFGLKRSAGGKDYFDNKEAKRAVRRFWKKKARRAMKKFDREE